jgi:Hypothetical protein (DUF2513)
VSSLEFPVSKDPSQTYFDLGGKILKRDMTLIRELLLKIEDAPTKLGSAAFLVPNDEAESTRRLEHLKLLQEAGLIKGMRKEDTGFVTIKDQMDSYEPTGIELTWNGHDFLDVVRDPEIWRKTKKAAEEAGGWSFDILMDVAKKFIKDRIGIK